MIRVRVQSEVENTLYCSGQKKRERRKLTFKSSWLSWAASGLWYELGPGSSGDEYVWKLNGSGEGLVWSGDMTPVNPDVGRGERVREVVDCWIRSSSSSVGVWGVGSGHLQRPLPSTLPTLFFVPQDSVQDARLVLREARQGPSCSLVVVAVAFWSDAAAPATFDDARPGWIRLDTESVLKQEGRTETKGTCSELLLLCL